MQYLFVSINVATRLWGICSYLLCHKHGGAESSKEFPVLVREALKQFFIVFNSQLKYKLKYKM